MKMMEPAFAKSKSTCLPTFIFLSENISTITISLKLNILIVFANFNMLWQKKPKLNPAHQTKRIFLPDCDGLRY